MLGLNVVFREENQKIEHSCECLLKHRSILRIHSSCVDILQELNRIMMDI